MPDTNPYSTDQDRWEALIQRDKNADNAFFYSVKTTGVYCRPSCSARLAHRENVTFHLTSADEPGICVQGSSSP